VTALEDVLVLPLPGLPAPRLSRHPVGPAGAAPAALAAAAVVGQLELPPASTDRAAVCCHCRQIIREAESASALLWLHPDDDPRCPFGGFATPAGWSA